MKVLSFLSRVLSSTALILLSACAVEAQSTIAEFPTPVRTNEINGTVPVRDLGDPRVTRYFYSFNGIPGDLIVSVEGKNLDGDIDVFTSSGLRPLAKITMYSGEDSTRVSKTIYLRKQEALILRVEARSPNDDPGIFRVRFDGAFAAIVGDVASPDAAESFTSEEARPKAGVTRVNSAGGRITDTEIQPAAGAEARRESLGPVSPPTVAETSETPERIDLPVEKKKTKRSASVHSPRVEMPGPPEPPPSPVSERKKGTIAVEAKKPAAPSPPADAGPRLIIESKDGMRVERYMSSVRKITVENGQIVILGFNGKVERHPMVGVLRMSIEP